MLPDSICFSLWSQKTPNMKQQTNPKPMVSILNVVNYNNLQIDLLNWCVTGIEVSYVPYWCKVKAAPKFVLGNISFHFEHHKDRHSRFSMGKIKNLCPEVLAVLDSSSTYAYPDWYFMLFGFSGCFTGLVNKTFLKIFFPSWAESP